ncbi:MAG: porin [Emcibacteraceae bacterium]|nr:porin [Emcibacteraceae bacterium]MDG1997254.1 porin [Emcibacteraceae bacterium]
MTNFGNKIRFIATMIGVTGTLITAASAYGQEQIRLNPNYKGPVDQDLIVGSNEIITENLNDDFIQFLNTSDDDGQYILLTEPEEGKRPIISLSAEQKSAPNVTVNQEYVFNPSISFGLSPSLIGSSEASFNNNSIGGSQIVISIDGSDDKNPFAKNNAVSLRIGSSFMRTTGNRYSMYLQNGLTSQQAYNLSLGVGYSGFQFGASFSRNDNMISSDLSGYDVGLGYFAKNWSANLRMGEYNRERSLLLSDTYNIFDSISAYELGAAYRLFPNINLTGRFTYYSYGIGDEVVPIDDVKSLIFGTNVAF